MIKNKKKKRKKIKHLIEIRHQVGHVQPWKWGALHEHIYAGNSYHEIYIYIYKQISTVFITKKSRADSKSPDWTRSRPSTGITPTPKSTSAAQLKGPLLPHSQLTPPFPNLQLQISASSAANREGKWAVWVRFWNIRMTYIRFWNWKWRSATPRSRFRRSRTGPSATLSSIRSLAASVSSFNSLVPTSVTPSVFPFPFLFIVGKIGLPLGVFSVRVWHRSRDAFFLFFFSSPVNCYR